jgi:ribosomal protein L35AE/L33A
MSHVRIKLIENINDSEFKSFIGKRIFYFTINKKKKKLKWGKIISIHGKSGGFLAKFKQKMPPTLIASPVFITFLPCNKYNN